MHAIVVASHGGPEVLRLEQVERPSLAAGEALVRVEAAGVNFIDVYHRTGLYPNALPFTPGLEGAGVVEEAASDARGLRIGDRVAWASVRGSYAEWVRAPAEQLIAVPETLTSRQAAAGMLQGLTAHYLTRSAYRIGRGDTALIHAAAGGVGLLLCQMACALGARVIGTVSTEEKASRAREAGAHEVILYRDTDFAAEVARLTNGRGVDVVYDSVGRDTFDRSLRSLRPRGMLVLFGASSGPVPPLDPQILNQRGSLFLTRPALAHYTANREELLARSRELFESVLAGTLRLHIAAEHPLGDAAVAHEELERRRTTGKLLLIP